MSQYDFCHTLHNEDFVIFDTETTGVERPAEVVQLGLLDCNRDVLLDTYLKPSCPIPPAATAIHGITDAMVASAPTWPEIHEEFKEFICGRIVVVYNVVFDRKLLHLTDETWKLPRFDYNVGHTRWMCAMEAYAEFWGEVHPYYGSYKWQSLSAAMSQQNLQMDKAHTAIGDCKATLALVCKMMTETLSID
jgi:DNA polymerase-3 subunit epsilon